MALVGWFGWLVGSWGRFWVVLGGVLGVLGASWRGLGGVWGGLGGVLGRSWGGLGTKACRMHPACTQKDPQLEAKLAQVGPKIDKKLIKKQLKKSSYI